MSDLSSAVPLRMLTEEAYREELATRPSDFEGNDDDFGRIVDWVQTCVTEHGDCQQIRGGSAPKQDLPKRLIDLSQGNALHIVNCEDMARVNTSSPSQIKYCALSYRWGDTPHSCVLTKPFHSTLEIPEHSMPQVFRDAATVARRLGIRYLWIDALCIVQPSAGDESEWLEEGSRMGIVYQNAICTIAATAALHANEGFLGKTGQRFNNAKPVTVHQRDVKTGQIEKLHIPVCVPSFYSCVSHSALNARGWVVQERALSTRIIHFTEHGIFWECGSTKAHSRYGTLQGRDDFPSCRSRETLLSVARTRRTSHLCPVEWFHFAKQYSLTDFTNPADRLLALSSVAKAVQPYLGGHEYIAGLWKNDLLRGLAWQCFHPQARQKIDTVPSWSWAAARGPVEFSVLALRTFAYKLVKFVDMSATPVLSSNPYGGLLRGSVTLEGRLTHERLRKPAINSLSITRQLDVFWDDCQMQRSEQSTDSEVEPSERLYTLLPIGEGFLPSLDPSRRRIGALILEPTGSRPILVQTNQGERLQSEFHRIGWVEYTYRTTDLNEKRSYWEERGPEQVVLV